MRGTVRILWRGVALQEECGLQGIETQSKNWCGSVQKSMEEDDERGAAVRAAENAVGLESAPDAALWPR